MKYLKLLSFVIVCLSIVACNKNQESSANYDTITVEYPKVKKENVVDNYFGVNVSDPYRWLEDPNSGITKSWVEAQNKMTFDYLEKIPFRNKVEKRLNDLWNYERYSVPTIKDDKTYFFKNDGLQNQPILYVQEGDKIKEVLNPNELRSDGTGAIGGHSFSKDGTFLAYAMADGGSDWRRIYVQNLITGETLPDEVRWVKFSDISWANDGFYYSRYPSPIEGEELSGTNEFHQVYYHKLGTNQDEDQLIFADRANAKRNFYTSTTKDERFLILQAVESTSGNALYFQDLNVEDSFFETVFETFEYDFNVIGSADNQLFVLTNHNAPMNRIIVIDTENPTEENWVELIAEGENVLQDAKMIDNKIIGKYLKNAVNQLVIFSNEGEFEQEIELPEDYGSISDFDGNGSDLYFAFQSFIQPEGIYQYDISRKGKAEAYKVPKTAFDASEYTTKQIFYYSKDNTKVPMFITHRKDLRLDSNNPTWLYGYGGFNISITPRFSPEKAYFLEQGGIYAVANIRGGGEFGERWHKSGTVLQKQNVFDDFIAAGEYLIKKEFTSSHKLAIEGRSNGGLLVGACMTQRPDLFQVALPGVGVLDMLRFHKFTIGWAWTTDYGSSEDSTQFHYLYNYSPLHNVQKTDYPATMVTTADHDDRVVPAHSYKFTSTLQENQQGDNPILIRIDTKAGHGAGKPTTMKIAEATDKLSFVFYNLNHEVE
ncbi:MAG: prolyl oligopeptidase family protein [Saprospiraceae bacterium]